MLNFLLAISFILHLFSLLAIIVLYQRRTLERLNLPSMKDDVETIHASIEAFIDELEQENEALYAKVVEYVQEKEKKMDRKLEALESRFTQLRNETIPLLQKCEGAEPANNEYTAPHLAEANLHVSHSPEPAPDSSDSDPRYKQVLELYLQGFSVEQIAKVLQIGKGEAALIVKMLQKQDNKEHINKS